MKEFLKKLSLRLLILAVIWVFFTQILPKRLYLGTEYTRWELVFGKAEQLNTEKKAVNLVLGDSRPEMGLASQELNAINLGLGGTSPVEGYYLLHSLGNLPIDTLYLSYSPFHFQYQDCFHTRAEYFGFVDSDYITAVLAKSDSLGDTLFQWNNWSWLDDLDKNFSVAWMRRQLRYLPAMRNLENYRWYFQARADMVERVQNDQYSYLFPSDLCPSDTTVQEYYLEQRFGGFEPNVINAFYFEALLQEVRMRKIHLVWVNMPLNGAIRQPSTAYYNDFELWLQSKLGPQVLYVPLATWDACQFKDFSHLDAAAAHQMAKEVGTLARTHAQ